MHTGPKQSNEIERRLGRRQTEEVGDQAGRGQSAGRGRHIKWAHGLIVCIIQVKRKQRQSGAALIMLTMMLATVMVPLVGLAIDGSIMFLIKTKLSASTDAAALAGARSLSVGMDIASQSASAVATAQPHSLLMAVVPVKPVCSIRNAG